jgi:hypothetical protein
VKIFLKRERGLAVCRKIVSGNVQLKLNHIGCSKMKGEEIENFVQINWSSCFLKMACELETYPCFHYKV